MNYFDPPRLEVVLMALLRMALAFVILIAVPCLVAAFEPKLSSKPPAGIPSAGHDRPELKRVSPDHDVWLDRNRKRVVMRGAICLERGPLEMFACLKETKEHESIVAVDAPAALVHAALLAVGAKAGHPVEFVPEYRPAAGTEIDVLIVWADAKGIWREAKAQDWIRNAETGQELKHPWVFAGSGFWRDERTGKEYYQAESGDFICVSNFPSAMLDLPIESSQATESLLYEAWTERIPPEKTKVFVVLAPKLKKN